MLQLALRGGHDFLQAPLPLSLPLRGKNKTHAAPAHAAEHPEAPEVVAELAADALDEPLGERSRGPRDDGLNRLAEVARRGGAERADVAGLQRGEHFVEDAEGVLATAPLGFAAEEILFRHHLQNRPDVLRHAAVDEHERVLELLACLGGGVVEAEDTVLRHEATARDFKLGVALAGDDALDELHAGPDAAAVLPAAAGAAEPFAEERAGEDDAALVLLQLAGERSGLAGRAHEHADERAEEVRADGEPRAFRDVVHAGDEFQAAPRPDDAGEQLSETLPTAFNARRHNAR